MDLSETNTQDLCWCSQLSQREMNMCIVSLQTRPENKHIEGGNRIDNQVPQEGHLENTSTRRPRWFLHGEKPRAGLEGAVLEPLWEPSIKSVIPLLGGESRRSRLRFEDGTGVGGFGGSNHRT